MMNFEKNTKTQTSFTCNGLVHLPEKNAAENQGEKTKNKSNKPDFINEWYLPQR